LRRSREKEGVEVPAFQSFGLRPAFLAVGSTTWNFRLREVSEKGLVSCNEGQRHRTQGLNSLREKAGFQIRAVKTSLRG
jgi:hypothetical protein